MHCTALVQSMHEQNSQRFYRKQWSISLKRKKKTKNNSVHSTYYEIISRYLFGLRSNKFTRACVTRAKCFFCAYSLLLQLIRFKIECHPRNVHLKLVHSHESFCFFICIHTWMKRGNPTLIKDRYHLFGIWSAVRLILIYYFNKISSFFR